MIGRLRNCFVITSILLTLAATARADRPSSMEILPEWTLGMIRIPDAVDFREKMGKTGFAEMLEDEEVKPFVQSVYNSITELIARLEQQLGMTLEQILEIPQGEILVAVVAPPAFSPAPVILMDLGDSTSETNDLLEEGRKALSKDGFSRDTVEHEGVEMEVYTKRDDQVIRIERDDTLVLTTDMRAAKRMIEGWKGKKKVKTLADNDTFSTIITRCEKGEEGSDLMWFIDPIRLVRAATRGNFGAQAGIAILPALGLDGFKGLGGSIVIPDSDSEFETISHMHVFIEPPRDGIMEMITLKDGDSRPEVWVPDDVTNYMTGNLDLQKSFSILKDLVDSFREEGSLSRLIKNQVSERIGINFEQNFIAELEGRMTFVQWYERPPRINSQATLIALKLHDVGRFRPHFETVMETFEEQLEENSFAGIPVYNFPGPDEEALKVEADPEPDQDEDERDARRRRRRARRRRMRIQTAPRPAFALIDDYLVLSDRRSFIEKIISTRSDASKTLRNSKEFRTIMKKLREQPNGRSASVVTYSQPSEALRMWYELIQTEGAREFMKEQRDGNPVFRAIDDALTENPLPPFSKLERYFSPSGGIVTNEEAGIHAIGFSLRPESRKEDADE